MGRLRPRGDRVLSRYFEWFDASTILLFEKATGVTKIKMLEKYGGVGLPLLEARAVFKVASRYGDDIKVETRITEFRRSTFFVHHRVTKSDEVALEAFETRLWAVRDPQDGNRLRSGDLPREILDAFYRRPTASATFEA